MKGLVLGCPIYRYFLFELLGRVRESTSQKGAPNSLAIAYDELNEIHFLLKARAHSDLF